MGGGLPGWSPGRGWRPAPVLAVGGIALHLAGNAPSSFARGPCSRSPPRSTRRRGFAELATFDPTLGALAALARDTMRPGERVGVQSGAEDWFVWETTLLPPPAAPRACRWSRVPSDFEGLAGTDDSSADHIDVLVYHQAAGTPAAGVLAPRGPEPERLRGAPPMTFVLTAAAIVALRIRAPAGASPPHRTAPVDVPLSWLAGSAWIGFASFTARGLLGVPTGGRRAVAVLVLPFVAWGIVRGRAGWRIAAHARRRAGRSRRVSRWVPRPAWLFVPMVAWTVIVRGGGRPPRAQHPGAHRRRATGSGPWRPCWPRPAPGTRAARDVIAIAGPIPTYVPALAWTLGPGSTRST